MKYTRAASSGSVDVSGETARAEAAEAALQTSLTTETSTRSSADTTLQTAINTEATTRQNADAALQTAINNATIGGGGTPLPTRHPLSFAALATKPFGFALAQASSPTGPWVAATGVLSTNKHRIETAPRAIKRLGVVYINHGHGFAFTDVAGPNPVTVKSSFCRTVTGSVPISARPYFALPASAYSASNAATVTGQWLDNDQKTYTLPPGGLVVFDAGVAVTAGEAYAVSTQAVVAAGQQIPLGSTPNSGLDFGQQSTSVVDATTTAYPWTGNSVQAFDYYTVVDLEDATVKALLVGGDSLNAGNGYGGATGLQYGDVPYLNMARSGEQCSAFTKWDDQSFYRSMLESRFLFNAALWQVLTNDADLTGQSAAVWLGQMTEVINYLRRRGISTVGWATLPPHTLTAGGAFFTSSSGTTHQYIDTTDQSGAQKTRGFKQQLMQDWNAWLRSGTRLYLDAAGWALYAIPGTVTNTSGTFKPPPTWVGGCAVDWWPTTGSSPLVVMETVNTSAVTADLAAIGQTPPPGYDFGGAPIMKWRPGISVEGLHDGGNPTIRAAAVRAVAKHLTGLVPLY